jgi:hypothetical protein
VNANMSTADLHSTDTQVAGAVVGALLETLLIPGLHLGKNPFRAPGCFYPGHVNGWQCVLLPASIFDCSSSLACLHPLLCVSLIAPTVYLTAAQDRAVGGAAHLRLCESFRHRLLGRCVLSD